MTDHEFVEAVTSACRQAPNAVAANLGGSRDRGDHRPDSDWDFAAYYRLAQRGVWALNEKRMVQWADLTDLYGRFAALGSWRWELDTAIEDAAADVAGIASEVGAHAG